MSEMNSPKRGDLYLSRHWRNPETGSPLVLLVTRVAQGNVYVRADYGYHADGTRWLGSASYIPAEDAEKYLGEKLPEGMGSDGVQRGVEAGDV